MHAAANCANCANCEAPLTGPYCAQCGQHAHESSRTVATLFHDAWHVVTHLDGRFWQTLTSLLLRPGRLTREYFAERRARYLPPVRLYLVLSVLFFAFAATGPHVSAERAGDRAAGLAARLPADAAESALVQKDVQAAIKESNQAGVAVQKMNLRAGTRWDPASCKLIQADWAWLESTVRAACERNAADGGQAVMRAFAATIPKMMFVFLPIMALVMLLIYWWPRRYYVEHLVFFLHTHAAIFLILILELVLSRLSRVLPWLQTASSIAEAAGMLYVLWYIYRAMRVYYGQGRWLTLAKFSAVAFAYLVFLMTTLLTTLALVMTLVS